MAAPFASTKPLSVAPEAEAEALVDVEAVTAAEEDVEDMAEEEDMAVVAATVEVEDMTVKEEVEATTVKEEEVAMEVVANPMAEEATTKAVGVGEAAGSRLL
ncbi:MAG: hypothetical protein Q9169_005286 [Polycauliona sp. 2 TL-2023]